MSYFFALFAFDAASKSLHRLSVFCRPPSKPFPSPYSLLPIPFSLLPIPYCLFPNHSPSRSARYTHC